MSFLFFFYSFIYKLIRLIRGLEKFPSGVHKTTVFNYVSPRNIVHFNKRNIHMMVDEIKKKNSKPLKKFTFAGLRGDAINFGFDVSQHFTFGFCQTAFVYHKALSRVRFRIIGWLGAGILRFSARNGNCQHEVKKQRKVRTCHFYNRPEKG